MQQREHQCIRIQQRKYERKIRRMPSFKHTMTKSTKPATPLHHLITRKTAGAALIATLATSVAAYALFTPARPTMDAVIAAQENPAQIAVAEEIPVIAMPESKRITVHSGDTLLNLLTDTGVSYEEAHDAVMAIREIHDPRRLNKGQHVAIELGANTVNPTIPSLASLSWPISRTATVELKRLDDGEFKAEKIEVPVTPHTVFRSANIDSSLYETGRALGLSPAAIANLIKAYSYDVDFQRDIKKGHRLDVVMDEMTTDGGEVIGIKNVVYAKLTLGKREVPIYRYTDKNGHTDYYNEKGESLKKALLKTPINGARISSRFGMRKHPILGYSKMHRGMDFAASTGTPIYAAGDGIVTYAGRKGGYGNYVQIKHNGKYATAYGHASRIAKGIRSGARVRQGQVIAYVGSTGRSTGPHLHYEVLAGGTQINPSRVQFKTGSVLAGADLKKFKRNIESVQAMIQPSEPTKVAAADTVASGKKAN